MLMTYKRDGLKLGSYNRGVNYGLAKDRGFIVGGYSLLLVSNDIDRSLLC